MINARDQLERARRYLADIPGGAERAVSAALNRAAAAARAESVRSIRGRYTVKADDVRRMISLTTATEDNLQVSVIARSRSTSIGYLKHSPIAAGTGGPGRRPMTVEILRGQRKPLAGAFVAPLGSGLRVMIRTGETTATGRAAMRSLYTVPLAEMLGVLSVREAVEARALEILDKRLDHELDRELAKAAAP